MQVIPQEEAVPAARLGELGQLDEGTGLADVRDADREAHGRL